MSGHRSIPIAAPAGQRAVTLQQGAIQPVIQAPVKSSRARLLAAALGVGAQVVEAVVTAEQKKLETQLAAERKEFLFEGKEQGEVVGTEAALTADKRIRESTNPLQTMFDIRAEKLKGLDPGNEFHRAFQDAFDSAFMFRAETSVKRGLARLKKARQTDGLTNALLISENALRELDLEGIFEKDEKLTRLVLQTIYTNYIKKMKTLGVDLDFADNQFKNRITSVLFSLNQGSALESFDKIRGLNGRIVYPLGPGEKRRRDAEKIKLEKQFVAKKLDGIQKRVFEGLTSGQKLADTLTPEEGIFLFTNAKNPYLSSLSRLMLKTKTDNNERVRNEKASEFAKAETTPTELIRLSTNKAGADIWDSFNDVQKFKHFKNTRQVSILGASGFRQHFSAAITAGKQSTFELFFENLGRDKTFSGIPAAKDVLDAEAGVRFAEYVRLRKLGLNIIEEPRKLPREAEIGESPIMARLQDIDDIENPELALAKQRAFWADKKVLTDSEIRDALGQDVKFPKQFIVDKSMDDFFEDFGKVDSVWWWPDPFIFDPDTIGNIKRNKIRRIHRFFQITNRDITSTEILNIPEFKQATLRILEDRVIIPTSKGGGIPTQIRTR